MVVGSIVTCFYTSFVHIIMNLKMSIHDVVGDRRMGLFTRITMKRSSNIQSGREPNTNQNGYPSIPHGYSCYVCGSTFETNQDRLQHLEKFKHIDLYSTGSPQEKEEIRRLSL
jgi:hypothetical protein